MKMRDLMRIVETRWLNYQPDSVADVLEMPADMIAAAQAELRKHVQPDGSVEVWRAMMLPMSAIRNLDPGVGIGMYWTYTKDMAIAYDGRGGFLYRFHARLPEESIDWASTIKAFLHRENEITAVPFKPIQLLGIEWMSGGRVLESVRPDLAGAMMTTGPAV